MVVEEILVSYADLVSEIGKLALWMQTIGLAAVFWMVFQIINLIFNRKKQKLLEEINKKVDRIESKLKKIQN